MREPSIRGGPGAFAVGESTRLRATPKFGSGRSRAYDAPSPRIETQSNCRRRLVR